MATAPASALDEAGQLQRAGACHGVPLPAAALPLPRAHPAVASEIPGATSRAERLSGIGRMRWPIPATLRQELRAKGLLDLPAAVPGPAAG